jgi:hypothetical protein
MSFGKDKKVDDKQEGEPKPPRVVSAPGSAPSSRSG